MEKHLTARCSMIAKEQYVQFRFYCDLSGALICTIQRRHGSSVMDAWESEGKRFFNRCRKCGRWVSDPMYNADTLQCVDCSPWEEQPAFCPQCGMKMEAEGTFCPGCGARLRYREEGECG